MREIIQKFYVYKYDELTEEQKEKVLNNLYDLNIDYDWWNYTYDDAKNIGLEIQGFDIDRGNYCKIKPLWSDFEIADQIIKNHGDICETYKHANEFMNDWSKLVEKYSDGIDKNRVMEGNEYEFDQKADRLEENFIKDLENDYLSMLKNEYEYQISREAIEETIHANEYEFTEEGMIY